MDTDCGHCREEVPNLERLAGGDQAPYLIALFKNDEDQVRAFEEEFQPGFPVGIIQEDTFWHLLGQGDVPRTLLINKGKMIRVWDQKVPDGAMVEKALSRS
jgi:hypothetical protein